jgi:hypothetical protein
MTDTMKDYVLAEHIEVIRTERTHALGDDCPYYTDYNVSFDWLCPNCGRRHWAAELGVHHPGEMRSLFLAGAPCSTRKKPYNVFVRFPWSDNTPRNEKSAYGVNKKKSVKLGDISEVKDPTFMSYRSNCGEDFFNRARHDAEEKALAEWREQCGWRKTR